MAKREQIWCVQFRDPGGDWRAVSFHWEKRAAIDAADDSKHWVSSRFQDGIGPNTKVRVWPYVPRPSR
jgi:hypothetical protein